MEPKIHKYFDIEDGIQVQLDELRDLVFDASVDAENYLSRLNIRLIDTRLYSTRNPDCLTALVRVDLTGMVGFATDERKRGIASAFRQVLCLPRDIEAEWTTNTLTIKFFLWTLRSQELPND